MREQHQQVVDRLVQKFKDDPNYQALIIGGSVAKQREQDNSDVDILLVATDEDFARRMQTRDVWYVDHSLSDYPGVYVDGKIIDLKFLEDAAERGSEPARAAFVGAFVAFSHIAGLEDLIARIPVYQEQEQAEKIEAFYSEVMLLTWFVGEAEKRNDAYLMTEAIANLVLFGGRLILAHNKILYPYHKWFMYELRRAPDKPAGFIEMIEDLLKQPTQEKANAFRDSISAFRDWGVDPNLVVVRFMEDNEWRWRTGLPPLADW
jgi:predicted nucleotidyltransferase